MSSVAVTNVHARPSMERAVCATALHGLNSGLATRIVSFGGTGKDDPEKLFTDPHTRALFSVIRRQITQSAHPTVASITDELSGQYPALFEQISAKDFITQLRVENPKMTAAQVDSHLSQLAAAYQVRTLHRSLEQLTHDLNDPDVSATAEDAVTRMNTIIESIETTATAQTFGEITQDILNSPRPMWRLKTGIDVLDDAMGGKGLESGTLTIIGARPKVGKTILMNSLIHSVLDEGGIPLVLNFETKNIEFLAKMIARHMEDEKVNWGDVKAHISGEANPEGNGYIPADIRAKINSGIEWAKQQEWFVSFDTSITPQDIRALVDQVKTTSPKDAKIVLFVDYLQLQVRDSTREREEITQLSRFYKLLAKNYEIAVVALSQLNRDNATKGTRPSVHNLRGSGSIEQDADVIVLLHRPAAEMDEADNAGTPLNKNVLEIIASTSRLSAGRDGEAFIDGGCQLVADFSRPDVAERRVEAEAHSYVQPL